jgi:hypothetical protein
VKIVEQDERPRPPAGHQQQPEEALQHEEADLAGGQVWRVGWWRPFGQDLVEPEGEGRQLLDGQGVRPAPEADRLGDGSEGGRDDRRRDVASQERHAPPAGLGPGLLQQPGLTRARLTQDEDTAALAGAGPVQGPADLAQLAAAPDDDRGAEHDGIMPQQAPGALAGSL